jgi:YidC/Oxa1 family membrane protein insertase
VAVAEFSNQHPQPTAAAAESAVTSSTPELAPAGIDKAAVTENAINPPVDTFSSPSSPETFDDKTLEQVLSTDPVKTEAAIDPTQLIDHAGQLKELGLDYGWGMTTTFEKLIETMYLQSGWGWAGSIMATTLVVRCGLFVLQALSSDKMAAMAAMKPVTQPIQEKLDAAIARGDNQQVQLLRMQQAQIMKPFIGGSAAMFGLMACQMWVGVSAFRFLRAMGELPVPGMSKDGFLWFVDLTTHDPYYLLPATTSAVMYTIFKVGFLPPDCPGDDG